MKILNKLYTLLIAAILMVAISCTETETQATFEGKVVNFVGSSAGLDENGSAIDITVQLIGTALSSDVTVSYTITEENLSEGVDYSVSSSSSVVIPAGEYSASISLTPIDNDVIASDAKSLTFTITDVSSSNISIGDEDYAGRTFRITILDDDFYCPRNKLSGITQGTDVGYSTREASISPVTEPGVECLEFILEGGANSLFGTSIVNIPITLVPDGPESNTGVIESAAQVTLTNQDGAAYTTITLDIIGDDSGYSSTSSYFDLTTGTLGFDYDYYRDGAYQFSGRFEYQ